MTFNEAVNAYRKHGESGIREYLDEMEQSMIWQYQMDWNVVPTAEHINDCMEYEIACIASEVNGDNG